MPPSGAKLPTCWKMHRRASHATLIHRRGFSTFRCGCVASQRVAGPIHQIACNALKCIFQHVGKFGSRFWNISAVYHPIFKHFQHNDELLMPFHVMCELKLSIEYIRTLHHETWLDCGDFWEDTCDDLRWSSMLLKAKNRKKMVYFIAACGRALWLASCPANKYTCFTPV